MEFKTEITKKSTIYKKQSVVTFKQTRHLFLMFFIYCGPLFYSNIISSQKGLDPLFTQIQLDAKKLSPKTKALNKNMRNLANGKPGSLSAAKETATALNALYVRADSLRTVGKNLAKQAEGAEASQKDPLNRIENFIDTQTNIVDIELNKMINLDDLIDATQSAHKLTKEVLDILQKAKTKQPVVNDKKSNTLSSATPTTPAQSSGTETLSATTSRPLGSSPLALQIPIGAQPIAPAPTPAPTAPTSPAPAP